MQSLPSLLPTCFSIAHVATRRRPRTTTPPTCSIEAPTTIFTASPHAARRVRTARRLRGEEPPETDSFGAVVDDGWWKEEACVAEKAGENVAEVAAEDVGLAPMEGSSVDEEGIKAEHSGESVEEAVVEAARVAPVERCGAYVELAARALEMTGDPLEALGGPVVLPRGSVDAGFMVIGEAPGSAEDEALLDGFFADAGFDMSRDVFQTNVVKRSTGGRRAPTAEEVAYYMPWIEEEIRLVDPEIIVLVGAVPLMALTGQSGIMRARGKFVSVDRAGAARECLPVFSPEFVLRRREMMEVMKADVSVLREKFIELFPERELAPIAADVGVSEVDEEDESVGGSVESAERDDTGKKLKVAETGLVVQDAGVAELSGFVDLAEEQGTTVDETGCAAPFETHSLLVRSALNMRGDALEAEGGRVVLYRGNVNANVMIIGEAPGAEENAQGVPFVGRAGQLLDDIFTYAGFDMMRDIYVTNVVKRQPRGNRTPTPDEMEDYMPWLEEEIRLVDPAIIVLAGNVPLKAVLKLVGITKARGTLLQAERAGKMREIIACFHPAYILRNKTKKAEMKIDIDLIRERYVELFPDHNLAEPRLSKPKR